jgi:hypothetical protein
MEDGSYHHENAPYFPGIECVSTCYFLAAKDLHQGYLQRLRRSRTLLSSSSPTTSAHQTHYSLSSSTSAANKGKAFVRASYSRRLYLSRHTSLSNHPSTCRHHYQRYSASHANCVTRSSITFSKMSLARTHSSTTTSE